MAGDQIHEIKEKLDIVDLISQYVSLKKAGKNYKALCPFHNEDTPSFMVSPELQIFKCFGCGRGGDIYKFLMEMEGVEFGEALQVLAEKAGVKLASYRSSPESERRKKLLEINHLASRYFHYLLTNRSVGKECLDYFRKERGFGDGIIKDFDLGYAPNSWNSLGNYLLGKGYTLSEIIDAGLVVSKRGGRRFYDRFRGRAMFALQDHRGQVVGFSGRIMGDTRGPKYLNTPESIVFNKSLFLYGLFRSKGFIKSAGQAVIVEGPTDFLTPFSSGTKNMVAAQGTALTLGQIKLLKRYTGDISICFDADLAGNLATKRGIDLAEKAGLEVAVITLPDGFKDPDQLARTNLEVWKEVVQKPIPVYDFYFQTAFKKYDRKTPEGKKQIAKELLPIIRNISDDIQRASYVQKLASELDVKMGIIEQALAKVLIIRSTTSVNNDLDKYFGGDDYPPREFYMLSIILRAPKDRAESITHRLGRSDFSSPVLQEFFTRLKRYHQTTKRFRLSNFRANIKGDQGLVSLLEELSLSSFDFSEEELDSELEVGLQKLKETSARRRIGELSRELRRAEAVRDQGQVRRLQEELEKHKERLIR